MNPERRQRVIRAWLDQYALGVLAALVVVAVLAVTRPLDALLGLLIASLVAVVSFVRRLRSRDVASRQDLSLSTSIFLGVVLFLYVFVAALLVGLARLRPDAAVTVPAGILIGGACVCRLIVEFVREAHPWRLLVRILVACSVGLALVHAYFLPDRSVAVPDDQALRDYVEAFPDGGPFPPDFDLADSIAEDAQPPLDLAALRSAVRAALDRDPSNCAALLCGARLGLLREGDLRQPWLVDMRPRKLAADQRSELAVRAALQRGAGSASYRAAATRALLANLEPVRYGYFSGLSLKELAFAERILGLLSPHPPLDDVIRLCRERLAGGGGGFILFGLYAKDTVDFLARHGVPEGFPLGEYRLLLNRLAAKTRDPEFVVAARKLEHHFPLPVVARSPADWILSLRLRVCLAAALLVAFCIHATLRAPVAQGRRWKYAKEPNPVG